MAGAVHFKPGTKIRLKAATPGAPVEFIVFCCTCRSYTLIPFEGGEVKMAAPRKAVGFALAHQLYEEVA